MSRSTADDVAECAQVLADQGRDVEYVLATLTYIFASSMTRRQRFRLALAPWRR